MIGVIADDITGAAEIGAVGLRHGLRAEILLAGEPGPDADLICIDTDSRSCDPAEAARRAAAAAATLRDHGATWIYKKTDSVLRGNVTRELEAVVGTLGLSGCLLVPANPSLGRTIVNGRYLIRGVPVHETDFARDPEYPRRSCQVIDLLESSETLPVSAGPPDAVLPERGIFIGGVAGGEDVRKWAALRKSACLMSGGAEFFSALLDSDGWAGRSSCDPAANTIRSGSGGLFVCGSASEAARNFVTAQSLLGVPIFSLPEKLAGNGEFTPEDVSSLATEAAASLQKQGRAILHVGLPRVADVSTATRLADHLVRVAEEVIGLTQVSRVFAEGGATAVALARRMGWARLAVAKEQSPGVATLTAVSNPPVILTIKPGSYAWPEAIVTGRV